MAVFGVSAVTLATFAGFGALVGLIFGFFGMGSFLVTPTLLVLGYDSTVAVGSGLAFVFGTAVIATLKHRDLGQVEYRLGAVTIAGTTAGIEVGKRGLLALRDAGLADGLVGGAYVILLGTVGTMVLRDVYSDDTSSKSADGGLLAGLADRIPDWVPRRVRLPPRLLVGDDVEISVWSLVLITFVTGLPAGLLGIGGGFVRIPALTYLVGVSMPVAVGTNVFAIMVSGGIGTFSWAQSGGVDLSVVAPLLLGSAFGARLGSAITDHVDEHRSMGYFGAMVVLGAVAVAIRQVGRRLDMPELRVVGIALIVGSAFLVAMLVLASAVRAIRSDDDGGAAPAD